VVSSPVAVTLRTPSIPRQIRNHHVLDLAARFVERSIGGNASSSTGMSSVLPVMTSVST
jgi:hypothetical protein